jgi:hypothetical protein
MADDNNWLHAHEEPHPMDPSRPWRKTRRGRGSKGKPRPQDLRYSALARQPSMPTEEVAKAFVRRDRKAWRERQGFDQQLEAAKAKTARAQSDAAAAGRERDQARREASEAAAERDCAQNIAEDPPHELVCPITQDVMVDPVVVVDGQTFERIAIEKWLAKHHTNPITGAELPSILLVPNLALRSSCESWRLLATTN